MWTDEVSNNPLSLLRKTAATEQGRTYIFKDRINKANCVLLRRLQVRQHIRLILGQI